MTRPSFTYLILSFLASIVCAFGQSGPSYLEPPQYYPNCFAGWTVRISVGDLNHDGRDDVVTSTANTWAVQLATPGGSIGPPVVTTFAPPGLPPFGTINLTRSVIGDFDRDGNQDLFFIDASSGFHPVYLGNGLGQFSFQKTLYFHFLNPSQLCTADFDMDGYPEIVVYALSAWNSGYQGVLHVISTVGGIYTQTMRYPTGLVLYSHKFADVTGDGFPDLVALAAVVGGLGPTYILVRQGLGNPSSFGPSWALPFPMVPIPYPGFTFYELVAADIDGNGAADLVLNIWNSAAALQPPTISTCVNPLSGANWWTMPSPGFGSGPFHAADVNGDGFLDLMGAENYMTWTGGTPPNSYSGVIFHSRLAVAMGNGNNQFQPPAFLQMPSSAVPTGYLALKPGDFDGDGDPDLISHYVGLPGGCGLARNRSRFGSPSGGGGLYSPVITSGLPISGNAQFSISLSGVPINAPALLGLSAGLNPAPSTVFIDFSPNNLILPAGTLGLTTTNAQGQASIALPLPLSPLLSGAVIYGQWGVANPQSGGAPVLSSGATFIIP